MKNCIEDPGPLSFGAGDGSWLGDPVGTGVGGSIGASTWQLNEHFTFMKTGFAMHSPCTAHFGHSAIKSARALGADVAGVGCSVGFGVSGAGHTTHSQLCISTEPPHGAPRFSGGAIIALKRRCDPPSQDFEHELHSDHWLITQSALQGDSLHVFESVSLGQLAEVTMEYRSLLLDPPPQLWLHGVHWLHGLG